MLDVNMLKCHYVECRYAEYHYVECRYAECHYVECRYAECHGAKMNLSFFRPLYFSSYGLAYCLIVPLKDCSHVRFKLSDFVVECDLLAHLHSSPISH